MKLKSKSFYFNSVVSSKSYIDILLLRKYEYMYASKIQFQIITLKCVKIFLPMELNVS